MHVFQWTNSSYPPGVFYTYFYNHAHRPCLEKLLYIELSRSPSGWPRLSNCPWLVNPKHQIAAFGDPWWWPLFCGTLIGSKFRNALFNWIEIRCMPSSCGTLIGSKLPILRPTGFRRCWSSCGMATAMQTIVGQPHLFFLLSYGAAPICPPFGPPQKRGQGVEIRENGGHLTVL